MLIRDTKQNPQEIILKNPPREAQQSALKITTKKDGKTLHHLEEQRRTIYTYHEGSHKV
jgi:hypothetical protein